MVDDYQSGRADICESQSGERAPQNQPQVCEKRYGQEVAVLEIRAEHQILSGCWWISHRRKKPRIKRRSQTEESNLAFPVGSLVKHVVCHQNQIHVRDLSYGERDEKTWCQHHYKHAHQCFV